MEETKRGNDRVFGDVSYRDAEFWAGISHRFGVYILVAAVALGVVTGVLWRFKGRPWGSLRWICLALLVPSMGLCLFTNSEYPCAKIAAHKARRVRQLKQLWEAQLSYSDERKGFFCTSPDWQTQLGLGDLQWEDVDGWHGYAVNAKLAGVKLDEIERDCVLVFESRSGTVGGAELLPKGGCYSIMSSAFGYGTPKQWDPKTAR